MTRSFRLVYTGTDPLDDNRRRRDGRGPVETVSRFSAVADSTATLPAGLSAAAEFVLAPRNASLPAIGEHAQPARAPANAQPPALTLAARQRFHSLYREHFDFVYRNLRWLGIPDESVDDALQDVYVIALRHIDAYVDGTHPKAWLFAILTRVASNHRRSLRRRGRPLPLDEQDELSRLPGPFDMSARAEAGRILHAFLDTLDPEKRAVFVMAELEQLPVPEIARALSANVNTIYTRLRVARQAFARAVAELDPARGEEP